MNFEKQKVEATTIRCTEEVRKLLKVANNHINKKHDVKTSYSRIIEELIKDYLLNEGVEFDLSTIE